METQHQDKLQKDFLRFAKVVPIIGCLYLAALLVVTRFTSLSTFPAQTSSEISYHYLRALDLGSSIAPGLRLEPPIISQGLTFYLVHHLITYFGGTSLVATHVGVGIVSVLVAILFFAMARSLLPFGLSILATLLFALSGFELAFLRSEYSMSIDYLIYFPLMVLLLNRQKSRTGLAALAFLIAASQFVYLGAYGLVGVAPAALLVAACFDRSPSRGEVLAVGAGLLGWVLVPTLALWAGSGVWTLVSPVPNSPVGFSAARAVSAVGLLCSKLYCGTFDGGFGAALPPPYLSRWVPHGWGIVCILGLCELRRTKRIREFSILLVGLIVALLPTVLSGDVTERRALLFFPLLPLLFGLGVQLAGNPAGRYGRIMLVLAWVYSLGYASLQLKAWLAEPRSLPPLSEVAAHAASIARENNYPPVLVSDLEFPQCQDNVQFLMAAELPAKDRPYVVCPFLGEPWELEDRGRYLARWKQEVLRWFEPLPLLLEVEPLLVRHFPLLRTARQSNRVIFILSKKRYFTEKLEAVGSEYEITAQAEGLVCSWPDKCTVEILDARRKS